MDDLILQTEMENSQLFDQLAIAAMQAVLSTGEEASYKVIAKQSYDMAEAMMKEREDRQGKLPF